jgi:WD40 repeat protein
LFAVNDLDWSYHYNYLLSGSDDTQVIIHDLNVESCTNEDEQVSFVHRSRDHNLKVDKSFVRSFDGHTHHVTSVTFDSSTSLVFTGSADKTAILWDIRSSQYIHKIEDHAIEIYGVDISQDNTLLLTAGKDGFVRLWELRTGLCLKTIKIDLTSRVGKWVFTPDSKAIIANNVDQWISAYEIETSKLIMRYQGHKISNGYYLKNWIHYQNDEIYILSGGEDGWIYGWNIENSSPVLKENILDHSNTLDSTKMSQNFDTQVEVQVPGEDDASKAIITWVDSSPLKGMIGWVDSYRNIHVASLEQK